MQWLRPLVLVCALMGLAQAQTVVFSGAGAKASPGGGSRSALIVGGQYFIFFETGSGIAYVQSLDGVTFSAPQPASTTPANLGFSVARSDAKLGLVWANNDAAGYSLWYREASIAGATLSFGAPELVASHPTETRGYQATLAYSQSGTPYIAAFDYGQVYTGPIGPGCGSTTRYRPTNYVKQGSWVMRSYCNNFDTIRDPNSIAISASGPNMIVVSNIDANLSTAIVNDTAELGEPWHMVPAVDHAMPGQMSAAQSLAVATDVHTLYRDGAGAIAYSRQDGTNYDLNATMLDTTIVSAAAVHPALSRPATGCYVATYVVGNSIRWRSFKDSIAALSPEVNAYTTASAPTNVSIELDAGTSPAIVWQEGSAIKLGFAIETKPMLTAMPDTVPADGASTIEVSSTAFVDACGAPLAEGTLVTITSSVGAVVNADASTEFEGTQVRADADGKVTFTLSATSGGSALVAAMPVTGGASATVNVSFIAIPPGCGDGFLDVAAGEQCDSSGSDTDTCNGANCQAPRCGDGYVNVAAAEQCEHGEFCDTECRYTFTVGGGCAGCNASSPGWLVVLLLFSARSRRRARSTSKPT